LAVGEQFGIDGARFRARVTLGYDIGPRVTMTLGGQDIELKVIGPHIASPEISALLPLPAARLI